LKFALLYPDLTHKGGAESVVVWTACGLARRGHEVRILSGAVRAELWPDEGLLPELIERVQISTLHDRRRRHLRTGRRLAKRLADFDGVYAHNRYGLLWGLPAASRLLWYCQEPSRRLYAPITEAHLIEAFSRTDLPPGLPVLQILRRELRRLRRSPKRRIRTALRRRREQRWAQAPRRVFVNSDYSARMFERCLGRPAERLDLGLPMLAPPDPRRPRAGIVVVSSRNVKKNLHGVLLAAAECLRRGILSETIHVWGIGTDDEEFRIAHAALGLGNAVVLHGFLPDEAARERMARARLCLFLPFCEPFGLVALEALQLGVPVLASDHGGPAEILERCGGGTCADPLDPRSVADGIERMLAPGEWPTWESRARAAGERVRELYSMERYLDRTEEALTRMAGDE